MIHGSPPNPMASIFAMKLHTLLAALVRSTTR